MQPNLLTSVFIVGLIACSDDPTVFISKSTQEPPSYNNPFANVEEIPLPEGFTRAIAEPHSFAAYLRSIKIKTDNTVYLYNGIRKPNQEAQFAVLDISVGKKDLQQCADAVMRLRAEYLFQANRLNEISFSDNNGKSYNAPVTADRKVFEAYLEKVYAYCGTLSLEKQLKAVEDLSSIQAGDVFIKGGSPGHAAIVMDVAANEQGEKIYLLANSYMPAQDIHIVLNPANEKSNPWFSIVNSEVIRLPEWTFNSFQLRRW